MPGREERRAFAGLLFTDVIGSTEIASEVGDHRWRVLLERHLAAVRTQLRRFQGREVDTAGDGLFAVFDTPGRAIRCAAAISSAVRDNGVEVRSGIHSGEIERSGRTARGIAVHVAARVISYAGPGEILVTQTVRDVVAGSPVVFASAGEHELRGVAGEWQLFKVVELDGKPLEPPLSPAEASRRRGLVAEPIPANRRRTAAIALAGALILAIGILLLLSSRSSGGSDEGTATGNSRPMTADEERLLGLIPAEVAATCKPTREIPPGGLAVQACTSDSVSVSYTLYGSASSMNDWFDGSVLNVARASEGDCATDHVALSAWSANQVPSGRVLCYANGHMSSIEWTDERFLVYGRASIPNPGDLDLYRWWAVRAGPWQQSERRDGNIPVGLPEGSYRLRLFRRDLEPLLSAPVDPGRYALQITDGTFKVEGPNVFVEDDGPIANGKRHLVYFFTSDAACRGHPEIYRWHQEDRLLMFETARLCTRNGFNSPIDDKPWHKTG